MSRTEPTPDEIRRDVARTRRELSDTAEALAYKADVPARVKEKAGEVRAAAKDKTADVTEQVQATARKTMDGLPEPVAQRVRDVVAAIRQRPVPFAVGAFVSIVVLRWIVRGRRS